MAPWKPLGGYEQQRKANVKGVVWETDQRPWEGTTGGKYETEKKISTVESDEDGEANAGANSYVLWLLSETKELAAVITLSTDNSCINENYVKAAFLSLGVH